MSTLTQRQRTIRAKIANGKPHGRRQRTDLDADIASGLANGQTVIALARALGCHPRLVRRVRDRVGA